MSDSQSMQHNHTHEAKNTSNLWLGATLALMFSTAAFFSGLHIGNEQSFQAAAAQTGIWSLLSGGEETQEEAVNLEEFWKVWKVMDQKLPNSDEVSTEEKLQGAINGLVQSYDDPYSVFLPPADAAQFGDDISGNFSGVGMEVGMRDGVITVIAPLPNTPAEKAGILSGDVVVSIDDELTEDMSLDEAVRNIRGERGTEVVLEVYREGETELLTISIVRDNIEIPTIETSIDGDVFVIALYSFNAVAEMKMQEALREYVRSGKEKLLLDLRGNPGGFLQSAVSIASYFLPTGEIVVRESFSADTPERVYRSQGRTLQEFAPTEMAVLVDGGSASASEILAGALSGHNVATLIGSTTFGKGSVQELIDFPSGASLKVTVARWLTPDGTSISDGGLTPDLEVERTRENVLEGVDPQYERALEWFNAQ